MLSWKVNGELLFSWALPVAFVIRADEKMLSSDSSRMKPPPIHRMQPTLLRCASQCG
jgi:hypothetical protein